MGWWNCDSNWVKSSSDRNSEFESHLGSHTFVKFQNQILDFCIKLHTCLTAGNCLTDNTDQIMHLYLV